MTAVPGTGSDGEEGRRRRRRPREFVPRGRVTAARWVARQEAVVLVAALTILAALFGFIKVAEEVHEGELRDFDEWLLRLLRQPGDPRIPIGPPWLLEMTRDITALGGRTILLGVVLFTVGYLALERKRGAVWLVALAATSGALISTVMKEVVGRGRPTVVPRLMAVASSSFPSGHAMLAAIIYLTLGALLARFTERRRTRVYVIAVAMLVTFLVGCSRVYLGVHYPSDVLAGWCAGLIWALVCWLVARYLQYRGAVE